MLKNLLFTSLSSLYYAIIPVYFSAKLFPKRTNSKAQIYITAAVSFILLWFLHIVKLYGYKAEATTLIQLIIFFNIFTLFKGSAKQKLLFYFIFLFISVLSEILSMNIYMNIYNLLIHHHTYTAMNIYSLCSFHEKLIIQMLIFSLHYLFCKNIVSLLQKCINYLKFTLLLLIIFPVFLPLIATEVLNYVTFMNHFIPVLLYIICCIISFLLFIHGLNLLKKEQADFNRNLHKMELLKRQMETSEEMKQEYVKIRKWNHDIENHLLSLSYLTDMQKTEEAEKYCTSVLQNNSKSNAHTPVCMTVRQEDSVL